MVYEATQRTRAQDGRFMAFVQALSAQQLIDLGQITNYTPAPPAEVRKRTQPGLSIYWTDGQGTKIDLAVGEGTHTCGWCHWRYTPNALPGDVVDLQLCSSCKQLSLLRKDEKLTTWEKYQDSVRRWRFRIGIGLIVVFALLAVWVGWIG